MTQKVHKGSLRLLLMVVPLSFCGGFDFGEE